MDKFSIEDIYDLVEMQHKAIGISFIPMSGSDQKYSNGITLMSITNYKLETILNNIRDRKNTSGVIIGIGYNNKPEFPNEQIVQFNTNEIYEIEKL